MEDKGEFGMNIHGKKIVLRAMELEDCELVREMFNDPEIEDVIVCVAAASLPISSARSTVGTSEVRSPSASCSSHFIRSTRSPTAVAFRPETMKETRSSPALRSMKSFEATW